MSWWTNFRDAAESIVTPLTESDSARKKTTGITGTVNKAWSDIGGATNRVLGRQSQADIRNQQYAINDQIQAYKDQTAITQQQINQAQQASDAAKRQVNEKQIRALRNNFRPAGGYLNNPGYNASPLGSDNSQPTKLGTA